MNAIVSPEAAEILKLMLEETRLPADWDTSGFWLSHAQQLAEFMASHRGRFPLSDAAMLLGLGGMLVEMAKRCQSASKRNPLSACKRDPLRRAA